MRANDAICGLVLIFLAAVMIALAATLPEFPGQKYGPALFPARSRQRHDPVRRGCWCGAALPPREPARAGSNGRRGRATAGGSAASR